MNFLKSKSAVTIFLLLFFFFNYQNSFSQKELKDALDAAKNKEDIVRDSLLKAIRVTANDTLRLDIYFQYFELSGNTEWIKYGPVIIKTADSLLNNKKLPAVTRTALLNRKARAKRYCSYYYNETAGFNSEKSLELNREAINLYNQTGNDQEITNTYINIADNYFSLGKLFDQVKTLEDGLKFVTQKKFNRGISRFYVQLQLFYANMGDTAQALSYLDKALKLEKIIADPTREARGYHLAGMTYSRMQKHQKAIDYFLMAIASFGKANMQQKDRLGQSYFLLGEEYQKIKEYDKALDIFEKGIALAIRTNDFRTIFLMSLAKGKALSRKGDFEGALKIHNGILKLAIEAGEGNKSPGGMCYKELAQDYYRHGDYAKAKEYMDRCLATTVNEESAIVDVYEIETLAHRIDSAGKFYEGAYKHYYQCIALKEKLNKEEVLKLAAKERFQSELELQKIEFKTEQEKKDLVANNEMRRQKMVRNSLIGGFALVLILAGVVFRSYRQKQRSNEELGKKNKMIEEKNKDITDSIHYAKRIQTSLLPSEKYIERLLNKKDNTEA